MKVNLEKLEASEIKITVTLSGEEFDKYHQEGFKKVQEFVQIDGFRKGNAPENLIVEKYGEMAILEEMSHLAINDTYYKSVISENENKKDEEKIFPISDPVINVIKLGKGSDFEYTATFATLPKIEVANYKDISKEENKKVLDLELEEIRKENKEAKESDVFNVSEAEVLDIIDNLRKARNIGAHVHADGTVHTESHDGENNNEEVNKVEDTLPELNDEFAQSFGENFKTVEDLKNKIKENLELEKKAKILDKKRNYILERLVSESKINLPEILINDELERMRLTMKNDVERYGSKWEEYLEHTKKTEDELKSEWRETAEKRAKSQLILNEIAKLEKVEVSKEDIFAEAIKIMKDMPEANEDHVKNYVHQILINEKVMKILDGEVK